MPAFWECGLGLSRTPPLPSSLGGMHSPTPQDAKEEKEEKERKRISHGGPLDRDLHCGEDRGQGDTTDRVTLVDVSERMYTQGTYVLVRSLPATVG